MFLVTAFVLLISSAANASLVGKTIKADYTVIVGSRQISAPRETLIYLGSHSAFDYGFNQQGQEFRYGSVLKVNGGSNKLSYTIKGDKLYIKAFGDTITTGIFSAHGGSCSISVSLARRYAGQTLDPVQVIVRKCVVIDGHQEQ